MADVHRTVQTPMEASHVPAEVASTSTLITEHVRVCDSFNGYFLLELQLCKISSGKIASQPHTLMHDNI